MCERQHLDKVLTAHDLAGLDLHLGVWVGVFDNRRQGGADHGLSRAKGRIVVDGENRDSTEAAVAHNRGLAGQSAVAVDALVHRIGDQVLEPEDARGGVEDGLVSRAAAADARLDERGVDAGVVGQGGDERGVDARDKVFSTKDGYVCGRPFDSLDTISKG